MFYLGRLISAFFNQLFRWLFWNKTGQKVLFTIVIFAIAVCFIKLGEVSAVEEVNDINYEVRSYYDGVCNQAILRIDSVWDTLPDNFKTTFLSSDNFIYLYFGSPNGNSYANAEPINNNNLNIFVHSNGTITTFATITNYDYMGVTGYTLYNSNNAQTIYRLSNTNQWSVSSANVMLPIFPIVYTNQNLKDYILAKRNGDITTITELLEDIKEEQQLLNENLTNDDVSNVSADLPQDTAVDPTDSLWGDMFDQVRTAVTSNSVSPISITIPFIDYSVVIEPAIYSPMTRIRNIMRPLYDFIILSWWFGASMWIVKDIHKYLEQIKNGDITAKDTNIKTEVL